MPATTTFFIDIFLILTTSVLAGELANWLGQTALVGQLVVGFVLFVAGAYILKGYHLHIPLDWLLGGGREPHTPRSERLPPHEDAMRPILVRMALAHGFVAGWGFTTVASLSTKCAHTGANEAR